MKHAMLEGPVVSIHIPPALRGLTGGCDEVMASGDTVGEVLESLAHVHPSIVPRLLLSDGRLAPQHELFLGASRVSELQGLATPVGLEELVSIVPASA